MPEPVFGVSRGMGFSAAIHMVFTRWVSSTKQLLTTTLEVGLAICETQIIRLIYFITPSRSAVAFHYLLGHRSCDGARIA